MSARIARFAKCRSWETVAPCRMFRVARGTSGGAAKTLVNSFGEYGNDDPGHDEEGTDPVLWCHGFAKHPVRP